MERISRMKSSMDSAVLAVVRRMGSVVCEVSMALLRERGERTGPRWYRPDPAARDAAAGPGRGRGEGSVGLTLGDLVRGVVPGVDQLLLDVVLVDGHHGEQEGRHDLDAVVVRLGVVGLGVLALEERHRGRDGLLGQQTGVLEDGRALDAL